MTEGKTLSDVRDWHIEGLDLIKALDTFGDQEILLEILQVFVEETPAQLDRIRDVTGENLRDYMVTVHGCKGSCRGVMAEPLGRQAELLEHAAKAEDFEYIRGHNQKFITDMEALLKSLMEKLEN